jgi:hypothetical protein
MNRRQFIKRMAAAGLVLAAPKIIFDLAPKSYQQSREPWEFYQNVTWHQFSVFGDMPYYIQLGTTIEYGPITYDVA